MRSRAEDGWWGALSGEHEQTYSGTRDSYCEPYGGTALALRIGHRSSVDFDFFSDVAFDPEALARTLPFLAGAERVQVAAHTLTCRVERGGPASPSVECEGTRHE